MNIKASRQLEIKRLVTVAFNVSGENGDDKYVITDHLKEIDRICLCIVYI